MFSHEQCIMVFYSVQAIALCRFLRSDQVFRCPRVSLDAVLPPKRNCRRTLLCLVSCSGIKAQSSFPAGRILRPPKTNCSQMALGMRRQAALVKKRNKRDVVEKEKRKAAAAVLNEGLGVAEMVRKTNISRGTVDRISKCLKTRNDCYLHRLLNPADNRAGGRCVITKEEDALIKQRIRYAAESGFALNTAVLPQIMASIASDGRMGFKDVSQLPSLDAIRSWRARNRDIKYRNAENNEHSKLNAENYTHVKTFAAAFRAVEHEHPHIFSDPDQLWNMDETAVSAEFSEREKVFGASDTHHGGFRSKTAGGCGKHITEIVAASESGRKTPPFFIVAGKNVMSSWFKPLSKKELGSASSQYHWLTQAPWFPENAVIMTSENGSMEKRLMRFAIEHINRYVRKWVSKEKAYCLTLGGHSSREG